MIGFTDIKQSPISDYQPSRPVINLTKAFRDGFAEGVNILNREWEELNNYSVINRMNKDQRTFNAYVDESIEDPMEVWKWRGTRSIARNKVLISHYQMTARISVPMTSAQNEKQEEDRVMSNVMRDILEWMATPSNSEYQNSYILATQGALVNPVTFMGADFVEAFTTIKERSDNGVLTEKKVIDEELSGFRSPVYSADQILITNAYEQNIQRQDIVIRRRYKEYHELETRWSWHPNWVFVTAGIKTVYSEDSDLFYDVRDDAHPNLVEEATGWRRKTDTEVTFLNGIYMGDTNVDANLIKHRDNFNIPKVPLVPFGYERINEHFFYFKSMINRVGWDAALMDAMYENTMNRESIDLYTPMGIYGVEDFSTQIVFPGSVVAFENPEARAEPLIPQNRGSGYQAMREIENSIEKETITDVQGGSLPEASQKAFTVSRAEQNAKTILKGAFRSIAMAVMQYGSLMTDIALQHLTVAQLDEITGAAHYRPFLLEDQTVGGKQVSKKIIFDDGLVGKRMGKKEAAKQSLRMLSETGFPRNKEHIYRINPHLFSKMKYLTRIDPEAMIEKNSALEKATTERMYALLRQDPIVSAEALVRDLLNSNYHGGAEERMAKKVQKIMGTAEEKPTSPTKITIPSTPQDELARVQ